MIVWKAVTAALRPPVFQDNNNIRYIPGRKIEADYLDTTNMDCGAGINFIDPDVTKGLIGNEFLNKLFTSITDYMNIAVTLEVDELAMHRPTNIYGQAYYQRKCRAASVKVLDINYIMLINENNGLGYSAWLASCRRQALHITDTINDTLSNVGSDKFYCLGQRIPLRLDRFKNYTYRFVYPLHHTKKYIKL